MCSGPELRRFRANYLKSSGFAGTLKNTAMDFSHIKRVADFPKYGADNWNSFRDWLIDEIITELIDFDKMDMGAGSVSVALCLAKRRSITIESEQQETALIAQVKVLLPIARERRKIIREQKGGQFSLRFN